MAKHQEIDIAPFENCIQDPQVILSRALETQNLRDFKIALEMDADPTRIDENKNISIFEKALQTHGCAEFVEECIRRGCKCDYINRRLNKAPINFATDSRDPKILSCILRNFENLSLDIKYSNLTPLLSLTKNLTSDNYNNVFECIKLLLAYGANPNIPDQREMLPLMYIINNRHINLEQKQQLIEYILQNSKLPIDLDSFRDGEARECIQKQLPDIILPPPINNSGAINEDSITFDLLLSQLRNNNENKFIQMYNEFIKNDANDNDTSNSDNRGDDEENHILLLHESIKKYLNNAASIILKNPLRKINVNYLIKNCSLVEVACTYGNWKILQQLLNNDNLKLRRYENLLINTIQKLDEKTTTMTTIESSGYPDYYKCFNILLNSNKININEIDKSGTSALHYAIKYKNEYAINKLLKYGAYIGLRSHKFHDFAINDINSNLLESHFNSCIKTNNLKMGDDNFEIIIDYKNLIPPSVIKSNNNNDNHRINQEMLPIEFIANSKEYRYLLKHPLITSFLYLKWYRLSVIFYINFILYSLFYISLITYIMLNFNASNHHNMKNLINDNNATTFNSDNNYDYKRFTTIFIFKFLSYIGLLYMIIRELIQIFISPIIYVRSKINYLEIIIIILTAWILYDTQINYDIEKQRILAVIIILLISIELCMLIGSLPILSISTHMLMLQTVSKSFIKSFALYSVFIITFSLCFYILFGKIMINDNSSSNNEKDEIVTTTSKNIFTENTENNIKSNIANQNVDSNDNGNDDDNDEFNKFSNPFTAIIKTIVMLTGEFDAGDIDFHSFTSYIVFLLFVFFMSIVLFNLLNGLAVSDTQAIKSQAELNGSICRTNLLSSYENVLTGNDNRKIFLINYHPFRKICKRLTNLFPNFINGTKIAILPNDNNKILIPIKNSINTSINDDRNDKEYQEKSNEIALIENNLPQNRKYIRYRDNDDLDNNYNDNLNNDNDNNENDEYEMKMKILNSPVNVLLPCCCFLTSFLNGQCSKMDIRTVKNALQIIEKNHLEKLEKQKLQANELRLKNIEEKIDKIFNILQEIHFK